MSPNPHAGLIERLVEIQSDVWCFPPHTDHSDDVREKIISTAKEAKDLIERLASGWRIPEGWKLVPIEPTEAMTDALERHEHYCDSCKGVAFTGWAGYSAMLDAAPPPPSQGEK